MLKCPDYLRLLREHPDDDDPGGPGNGSGGGYQQAPGAPGRAPEFEDELASSGDGRAIRCIDCRAIITWSNQYMEWGGKHRHVFFNPHGLVYEVGCFAQAPGCGVVGAPCDDFSWFPGHTWQVALCNKCLLHMGWLYRPLNSGGRFFFGLILEHMVEDED